MRRRNSDREVRELRRRVVAGGAEDASDVVALAAAMTRTGDFASQLGSASIARAVARRLFWIDVGQIASTTGVICHAESDRLRSFATGHADWTDVHVDLRDACERTGRLSTPDGWREILAATVFPIGGQSQRIHRELDLARRALVDVIEAEARRLRRRPDMPEHGMRVIWNEAMDHYPNFVVAPGTTGTVVQSDGREDPAIVVRVDQIIDGAEEWNNEVHWPQHDMDVFWSEIEPLEG